MLTPAMDTDFNDAASPESLNGEALPDPATLAHSAIIKQDVMLSATSQSPLAPVSSMFTIPTVSSSHASIAGFGSSLLADQLFMSPASVTDATTMLSGANTRADLNGNESQHLISIPVSLGVGANQQIQLLSTSNGQIFAANLTNLQSLGKPLNLAIKNQAYHAQDDKTGSGKVSVTGCTSLASRIAAALPPLLTSNSQGQLLAISPQILRSMALSQVNSTCQTALASSAAALLQSSLAAVSVHARLGSTFGAPTINGLPQNICQLLPNTVGNCMNSTTVDGINLDEIKDFARHFKIRRLSLGLTQTQVGQALSATEGPAYSQSAICRFEKLDITPKSAQKIKPVLEHWMSEAELRCRNGVDNLTDFIGSEPSKKRKRRTSFSPQALELLNQYFKTNTHPSGTEMTDLSEQLNYDREVVRVWFCNKRQALKNTIKKLKHDYR